MNKLLLITAFTLFLFGCSEQTTKSVTSNNKIVHSQTPKNIIFMIGDGMGLGQITAGIYTNGNTSYLEEFKNIGFHKSYSASDLITDSAAGATAFACGQKTYNGAIAVSTDTLAIKTILEYAEKNKMATGLVATSTITHATPACYIAHNKYRRNYEEIALDFLDTEVDLFIGGGKNHFNKRKDNRNLIEELEKKNYFISDYSSRALEHISVPYGKNFGYFTADDSPQKKSDGRDYLPIASEFAARYLDKKNDTGFFLMIEGSQIDWGGHANDAKYITDEFLDFDKAIGKILTFAKNDGETLVIITADHETGGFSINDGSTMDSLVTKFTTDHHSGTMIPVFAYGPGSEQYRGIYENTELFYKMMKSLNLNK